MKRFIPVVILYISCLTSVLWLTGCKDSDQIENSNIKTAEVVTQETWKEYADTPVDLNWYINFSWYSTGWGENLVSRVITEETGVSVQFITPTGNEAEKLNSLISSDTLPDIITLGWWECQVQELVEHDMVYALNELADKYDPYFYKVIDENSANWYENEDGNLYCYPNSSYSPQDYEEHDNIGSNQTFLVRKDLYEAIGSPDMSTPEGFKAAILQVAAKYPEVDGYPLIPIGSDEFTTKGCNSFDLYLQNFLAIPYEKDGVFYDRFTDPEYITWLKVFRELNEEGYLANDIFIDKRTQMEEKITQGRYFCMLYQSIDILRPLKILYNNNPDSVYMAVDGPRNSKLDDPVLPGSGINGWTVTFISKNCKEPDRAIAFLSYLISEHGQKMVYLGVEGKTYDVIDGTPIIKPEVQKLLDTNRDEYDKIYGADDTYWMMQNNMMQMQWERKALESEAQLTEWTYPYTAYTGQYDIIFSAGTDEANIHNTIQEEWGITLPNLLLAKSEPEFDEILAEFIRKRASYGYEVLIAYSSDQMDRTKKKMGLE